MFTRRAKYLVIILVIFICAIISITFSSGVFSYDTAVAHPNIVGLATQVYNKSASQQLTDEEINWLKKGAEDEDMPTRWMNHFYDPIYNMGFKGLYLTAKAWSQNSQAQSNYALGDYSWERAITDYQNGNEEEAFVGLGHTIHLVSDMSVPAHTRDDAHPSGDSLEQYIKNNWNNLIKNIDINKLNLKYYSDINEYFNDLAKYSNNNFYSDDTIESKKYNSAIVVEEKIEKNSVGKNQNYRYSRIDNNLFRIYVSDIDFIWQQNSVKQIPTVKDDYVLVDYSKILLPQAIEHSAGVIKLFFEEVNKKQEIKLSDNRETIWGKLNYILGYGVNKVERLVGKSGNENTVVAGDVPQIEAQIDTDGTVEIVPEIKTEIATEILPKINSEVAPEIVAENITNIVEDVTNVMPIVAPVVVPIVVPVVPQVVLPAPVVYHGYGGGGANTLPPNHPTTITTPETTTNPTPDANPPAGEVGSPTPTTTIFTSTIEPIISPLPAPVLDSQFSFIIYTTSTAGNITGACSASTTEIIIYNLSTSSTEKIEVGKTPCDNLTNIWSAEVSLLFGDNYFDFVAQNSATSSAHSAYAHFISDNQAPAIPTISVTQTNFTTPTLHIIWSSTDEVSGYDVEVSDGGDFTALLSLTSSTDYIFSAEQLKNYNFRARAYDNLGNVSAWSNNAEIMADWRKTVVMNEIAWLGTGPASGQTADEWLELYNNTEEDIDLTGWKLLASGTDLQLKFTSSSKALKATPIIPAHSYYLIERTDDDAIYGISAGALFTGALNNNGEKMILQNNLGEIIDVVDCSATGNQWFNQADLGKYYTMQRKSTTNPGSLANNWQSGAGISSQVVPYGGGVFYGSPKQQNIGYWLLKGDLSLYYPTFFNNSDKKLVLTKESSPYIIDYQTIIPAGYTLQIDPGVVLYGKDKSSYFKVAGNLILNGTSDDPIVFTSALDQNYVKNNLSTLTGSAQAGDWSRIAIQPGGNFTASNAKFLYGGKKFFYQTGVFVGPVGHNMSNIIFNLGGAVNLDKVVFENNYLDTDVNSQPYNAVIYTEAPQPNNATTTVSNSSFSGGYLAVKNFREDNGQTIYSSLTNNSFVDFTNLAGPIEANRDFVEMNNNSFSNNANNGVYLSTWNLTHDSSLSAGVDYVFGSIVVPAGLTLTLNPGVNLKFRDYGGMQINGNLQALGTADQPINILPQTTSWGILNFNNAVGNLQYVNLSKGNHVSLPDAQKRGMITAVGSVLNLENVSLEDSERPYNMVYLQNSTTTIKNSNLSWSSKYGGSQNIDGIKIDGGNLQLDNVKFNEMSIGIEKYNNPVFEMLNMGLENFQNIRYLSWWPLL